ncbi:MAG: DUF58 domain-containing protein, partial [Oscillospiraceae bacterium]|nr:DUF58 domain-containing protein [Oscillospiraceae bacterium]
MKEFRIFFVVTIVVLFVLCFAYHSRLMPLLLLAVILLCGFSFLIALVARAFFVVEVQNGESQIRRKSSVFLKLRIKNRFIMPLAPLCVYVKVLENGKYDSQKKMLISTLHPFKEIALNIQNDAVFRGQYTIGLEKVQFYDLLKIFKFSVKQKIPWELTVYPREMPIDEELLADENEEEPDVTNTKPYGFNKDTFSYLREYKTGETLRHIHWKMSARFAHDDSSLIVKQMEANHDRAALIFCDFNGEYSRIEEALERSDEIIETAIMLSRGILTSGNGNSAIVFWQAKQEYAPKDGLCSSGAGYLDGKQALQVACSVAK